MAGVQPRSRISFWFCAIDLGSTFALDLTADVAPGHALDEGTQIGPLVDAAQTPPFLTDRRVVVGRHVGMFTTTDAVAPLIAYLADPLPTTALVLVWEKSPKPDARLGRLPTKLSDAIKQSGGVVVETAAATGSSAASNPSPENESGVTLTTPMML